MGHAHAHDRTSSQQRMLWALGVTVAFVFVEVAGAVASGSLALAADAAHLFMDSGALLLAYAAMRLADRGPTRRHTFGLHRAEVLAAFVNAQLLFLISGFLVWEAYRRFQEPSEIETGIMLGVAIAGLAANVVAATVLHGAHHASLNVKAAYLEVVTDALTSVGVIVAAVLIPRTGWVWLDPVITVGIALLILPRTIGLLRASGHILLEGAPEDVSLGELRSQILSVPGVEEVHDLHYWTLTSGLHSLSIHVRVAADSPRGTVLQAVQRLLREEVGIDHATVQVEWGNEMTCERSRLH